MDQKGIIVRVIISLLFFVSLYFVEAGFCGSSVVAKYNNGFGTLDMKSYDVEMVQKALSPMSQKGLAVYKQYYLMDFIFILFFGAFQIMITNDVFSFKKNLLVQIIIIGIPILRGICDIVENIILLRTLYTFPRINELAISISSKFTAMKFLCIKGWILLIVIGLGWRLIINLRR